MKKKTLRKLITALIMMCLMAFSVSGTVYADEEEPPVFEETTEPSSDFVEEINTEVPDEEPSEGQDGDGEEETIPPEEETLPREEESELPGDEITLQEDTPDDNGWYKAADGYWYYYTNGVQATGWKQINSTWYYFGSDGRMQTGWKKIGDKWYYLRESGAMATGWIKLGGVWYYLKDSGAMVTGWQTINGKQYYFKSSGAMAVNEWVPGYWWLGADGVWTYKYKGSWHQDSKGWWFGDTSGWYAKNTTIIINGKSYTFDSNGYLDDSFTFAVSGDGAVLTKYSGSMSVVVIPDRVGLNNKMYQVTAIGEGAFRGNSAITEVVMPDSIRTIGADAFKGCTGLSSITRKNKKEVYVFIGDSYGNGMYGGVEHPYSNWIYYVTKDLGISDYYKNARNGMGFVSGISGTVNGADRSYYSLLAGTAAPSETVTQVVIMGGYNDLSYSAEMISLYVQRVCLLARTMYPNAVVSVGMYGASAIAANQEKIDNVVGYYQHCTWYGCHYAEGMENVLKSNMSAYMTSDAIHPNDAGQRALAAAIGSYLTKVLDLPADLTYIGEHAFEGCSSVKRVVNNSGAVIEDNAFAGCSIPQYPGGGIITGWQKAGGRWFFMLDSGEMATGWQQIDGFTYYFNPCGIMQTGWIQVNGNWYFMAPSGEMAIGWKQISGKWYYFDPDGVMVTGWKTVNGKQYFFKSSGVMAASEWVSGYWWLSADGAWSYKYKGSWHKDENGWWFGDTSGWYAKNTTVVIDGKSYTFDANGYMK